MSLSDLSISTWVHGDKDVNAHPVYEKGAIFAEILQIGFKACCHGWCVLFWQVSLMSQTAIIVQYHILWLWYSSLLIPWLVQTHVESGQNLFGIVWIIFVLHSRHTCLQSSCILVCYSVFATLCAKHKGISVMIMVWMYNNLYYCINYVIVPV